MRIDSAVRVGRDPKAVWSEPTLNQFQTSSRPPFDMLQNCSARGNVCTGHKELLARLR